MKPRLPRIPRLLYVALLAACDGAATPASQALPQIPTLGVREVALSPDSLATPFGQVGVLADPRGGVYFLGKSVGPEWITHLDSSGRLIRRFGRSGAGPGELSGGGVLLGYGIDSLLVLDSRRSVAVVYDSSGELVFETPVPPGVFPLAAAGGVLFGFDPGAFQRGAVPQLLRIELGAGVAGEPEPVVDETRAVFAEGFDRARAAGSIPGIPVFASDHGWRGVVDGVSGRLVVLGASSPITGTLPFLPAARGPREYAQLRASLLEALQPAAGPNGATEPVDPALQARLDTLDRERSPFVAWPGLFLGQDGRVTIVAGRNDSTAVDVFEGGRHVAHAMLACFRPGKRISLRGNWLALQCEDTDDATTSYALRLFHLDPGSPE